MRKDFRPLGANPPKCPSHLADARLAAGVVSAVGGMWLYEQMRSVKLLGLPHIIAWTPLAIYLGFKVRSGDVPRVPRIIMGVTLATLIVSLAFDDTDAIRYVLGERTPLALPT